MLQQTQIATVIPYFERFVQRFPTVRELAAAPLEEVLCCWAGLGYYARARNLHRAARVVADDWGGQFRAGAKDLQDLPGVGRYTAGAISSIAFDRREAAVDGNIKRVLARLWAITDDVKSGAATRRLWSIAEQILPSRRCGDFNQALMELGATVCLPRRPTCTACPLAAHCRARAAGLESRLPRSGAPRKPRSATLVVAAIRRGSKYLLRRRGLEGLWGGLWEMPCTELAGRRSARIALAELLAELGHNATAGLEVSSRPIAVVTHQLTHRRLRMPVYACTLRAGRRLGKRGANLRWVSPDEFGRLASGRAQHKVFDSVLEQSQRT